MMKTDAVMGIRTRLTSDSNDVAYATPRSRRSAKFAARFSLKFDLGKRLLSELNRL